MKIKSIIAYIRDHKGSVATIAISALIIFFIARDLFHALSINIEISKLEHKRQEYQESITRDSTLLERLKSDEELVRYARETYHMKRDNEDVFIIK
ncbi:MAG: septum formation initiator family protein [Rikenellaceae bacterium]